MELVIMDKDFKEIGTVDKFSSLLWHRKYFEPGSWSLQCEQNLFENLDQGVYVFRKGYELALIDEVDLRRTSNNETLVTASGKFVEEMLNDRVYPRETTRTGTYESIARGFISDFYITDQARRIPYLELGEEMGGTAQTSLNINRKEIGDALYTMLEEAELSQRIDYDYLSDRLIYRVWKGLDRTQNQNVNSWAVFSDGYENITDTEYSIDRSQYKNFCYVVGKDPVTVEVDQTNGERRREMVVSQIDETNTSVLRAKGEQALSKYKKFEKFSGRILANSNLVYRTDYDLGDLVTCINTQVGKMADLRITEVKEVYEDGEITITPIFGNDYLGIVNYIKREGSI